ncbi:FAD-dependent oxidoreductase [Pseudoclavibacter sp. RFBG4]|uniref:flavin monoamine oxidase family protein n=1 Tax=Pseudoclavibacter sp. RFBG4 TaxID=2080575 RepID=UPI000CE8BAC1|nr:NAD(P)/FAD-dependent oxidoreductase [Pseudoclavibacter sp. RFBG4]PPG31499.1 FAD-dependent oxidoreductase [Pseudoclavibacter sp. RFBG4]
MRIIVIGAGLAGLTAAWELRKRGHDVSVLEARARVGGRTWSQRLGNGAITERGGEYVFPTEFAIRRLSAELGVPILSHNVRYARRTVDGRHVSFAELEATTEQITETLRGMLADGLTRVSVEDAHREALGPDYQQHPVYRRMVTSLANDPNLVSAASAFLHDPDADQPFIDDGGRFVGGNQSLAIELARRLGAAVRLEHPARAIDQSDSGVEVTLADGSAQHADAAVIAVPLPILRSLRLGFALTPGQDAALSHRIMGTAAKLGVPLAAVDDDIALQSADLSWWSWRSLSADGEHRIPALSCFAGSRATLDALGTEAGPGRWLSELQALRPGLVIDGDVLLTDWSDDPWTRGSYSAASLDWTPADLHAFDVPAGRVVIAGEHTGLEQTLNGAVVSGLRAVTAIGAVERLTETSGGPA